MEREGEKSFYFKGERKESSEGKTHDWKTAKIKSPQTSQERPKVEAAPLLPLAPSSV